MRGLPFFLLLFIWLSGCDSVPASQNSANTPDASKTRPRTEKTAPPSQPTSPPAVTSPPASTAPLMTPTGNAATDTSTAQAPLVAQREDMLRKGAFFQVKPMSSRSLSLRLLFGNQSGAIFKPLQKDDSSARLEVAYYRLAKLMGVRGVPVSVMRPIYPSRLEPSLAQAGDNAMESFLEKVELDEKGRVWGATIEWLQGLELLGIEDAKGRLDVKELFSNELLRPLWSALSDMVLLDFLLANWDRFSGGNLFRVGSSNELALIDHNEAFYKLSPRQQQKLNEALAEVRCPSAGFIANLRALTKEKILLAVKTTEWTGELLRPVEIRNILMRKDTLLQFIDTRFYTPGTAANLDCQQ